VIGLGCEGFSEKTKEECYEMLLYAKNKGFKTAYLNL